ncbi:hypothetical protein Fmac_029041 [Flemingia macrophylla]|uniref:Serine carboxypeptidase-like 19 n=1 Tax=Flemingia macrophylla TaxID=520843 RepID=A0ABD1L989_9FABA
MIANWCSHFHIILLLSLAIFVQISSQIETKVEVLPGFEGPLPFELQTGYIGLGERDDDMQVFYYFIKSENDPQNDPLMLWLSGGPGCSSVSAILFQFGPLAFDVDLEEYDETGTLPNLILRSPSWTKVCSIIFVDLPFGTGFSYAKNATTHRSDWKLVHHTHQFLKKWLIHHPEFHSNEFYVGGDSYSGIPVPAIVQEISNENEISLQPHINLQGYLLGNPITTHKERNHRIPFAHGMGLISDELYACFSKLNLDHILKPCYEDDLPKKHEAQWRRSLSQNQKLEVTLCKHYENSISNQWANYESVRKSLHIREGTIGKWQRCYKTDFEYQIFNSFDFHANLSAKGYRSLIYSGDHDGIAPLLSTQAWIRALNYSIVEDWRPWLHRGQVAGDSMMEVHPQ